MSDKKRFHALTPDVALNYTVIPAITLFASFGMGFKNPTDKELESPDPAFLYNQDLRASRTNRLGFAVQSRLEIYKDLNFSASYSFSQYIYRSYTANSIETDSTGNIVSVNRDFSGHAEPNFPRNNMNLSLSYKHPVGEKAGIFAKVSYVNVSGLWVDDANSEKQIHIT